MTRTMRTWWVGPWLAMAPVVAMTPGVVAAQETRMEAGPREVGAMLAPATLPEGGSAVSAWVGVPELGVAYRQGLLPGWEMGARARFDYLRLSTTAEVTSRVRVWTSGDWTLAPELGLGVTGNPGSRYFDTRNVRGWFLRVNPALVATYSVTETVTALGQVEVAYDQGLSTSSYWRVKPLGGVGAEVYIGEDLTLSLLGQLGVDVFHGASRITETQLGYGVRLGLGLRLF
ncbi:hypothetical protein [Archangium primigenium]|uniref:hypothetical protein n=1 Tax=[Archangium] primigenium TaxID=2792470 RepID=UPI00195B75C9|nr:hypothetical protein [Archangium primigenium]MBM7117754.1 hypothetical protein [Archangium primigenium]